MNFIDKTQFNTCLLFELCEFIEDTVDEIIFNRYNKHSLNKSLDIVTKDLINCKRFSNKSTVLLYIQNKNANVYSMYNPESITTVYLKSFYSSMINGLTRHPVSADYDSGYESNEL